MRNLTAALWAATATVAVPVLRLSLRRRAARGKEIADRLPEREGIDPTPRPPGHLVWLHAASMGESQSVLPVIERLCARPGLNVLVTSGTVTSAVMLADRLPPGALHRFAPLDVPRWAARFLRHWRPDAAVFVESELWPNLVAACQDAVIPLLLVNARLSVRSFRGWGRAPRFAARLLGAFAAIHPQTPEDADRLRALGAANLVPPGNLKLAAAPLPVNEPELARLRALLGTAPVWLAASTHPDEENAAAAAHRALLSAHPGLVTVIAPRHCDRGPDLAAALACPRRGAGQDPAPGALWLADTMGEMGLLYSLADFVFVGGSLAPRGGQNPMEAARFGRPVAMGPHTENNAEPVARLSAAGALTPVADPVALTAWAAAMLADPAAREAAGRAAEAEAGRETALPDRVTGLILAALPA